MEIVNICTINFFNNTIWCEKFCCSPSFRKDFWDSWYTWFGIALLSIFVVTALLTLFANSCKKRQQNLIRISNSAVNSENSAGISTISGPGGIIQPDVKRFYNQVAADSPAVIAIAEPSTNHEQGKVFAKPLIPAYPPVKPVKIIKGFAPSEGYRRTDSYTEIVLPPGFIDCDHYKP